MQLGSKMVHVWQISWRDIPAAEALLSKAERAQADRYKTGDDRRRYVTGRALLRQLSAHYLGITPDMLAVAKNAHGKPYWQDYTDKLSFNLSHSGDWIILAFADGADIGVDVQLIDTGPRFRGEKVVKYALHPDEREALAATSEDKHRELFYGIWTLKEATIKAMGLSLHGQLERFSVFPLPVGERWLPINSHNNAYSCRTLNIDARHKGALAISGAGDTYNMNILSISDLPWHK